MNEARPAEPPIEHIVDEWVRTFTRRIGRPPNELEAIEFAFTCEVTMLRTAKEHLRGLIREVSQARKHADANPKDLRIAARALEASARAAAWKGQTLVVLAQAEATARDYVRALERERRRAEQPSPGLVPEQKPSHTKEMSRRLDSSTGRGDGA